MAGKCIIVTGPSASGKTTLVNELLARIPGAGRLVTTTTRSPRPGEIDGVHYRFLPREIFAEGIARGDFFEYADVYGNYYGSSKGALAEALERHSHVFVVIDVNGAKTLSSLVPDSTSIFLRPGSVEDVKRRLASERDGTPDAERTRRLATALQELELADSFDTVIENREGAFEQTLAEALEFLGIR